MIVLRFEDAEQDHSLRVGPFPYVQLNGSVLCEPSGEELAIAAGAKWHVGQERFYAIVLESPVQIELDNEREPSQFAGAFSMCRILDGLIRAGDDYSPIAILDYRTNLWYAFNGGTLHTSLTLRVHSANPAVQHIPE